MNWKFWQMSSIYIEYSLKVSMNIIKNYNTDEINNFLTTNGKPHLVLDKYNGLYFSGYAFAKGFEVKDKDIKIVLYEEAYHPSERLEWRKDVSKAGLVRVYKKLFIELCQMLKKFNKHKERMRHIEIVRRLNR